MVQLMLNTLHIVGSVQGCDCFGSLVQRPATQGLGEGCLHSWHPGTPTQQFDRVDVHPGSALQ